MERWIEDNLIFLGVSGSVAYGTNTSESDIDYRGATIPTKDYLFGLKRFEQFNDDAEDKVIYSIQKLFKLLLESNPNILELLFLPEDCIIKSSNAYIKILNNRSIFLSIRAARTFGGYADAQFKKMSRMRAKIEGFGKLDTVTSKDFNHLVNFDTKNAMHLIRLLNSGKSLVSTGVFEVRSSIREILLDIRNGKYSYGEVLEMYEDYRSEFESACENSPLPTKPNFDMANMLCIELIEERLF